MSSSIRWDAPLPGPEPAYVPIVRAPVGATLRLVAVNGGLERAFLHFVPAGLNGAKAHTEPCLGRSEGCICGVHKLRKLWYGYLAAWCTAWSRIVLAEFTPQAVRECNMDLTGDVLSVRGLPFRMWRRGKNANSPVRVEFDPKRDDTPEVPPAIDVRAALVRIWKVGELGG